MSLGQLAVDYGYLLGIADKVLADHPECIQDPGWWAAKVCEISDRWTPGALMLCREMVDEPEGSPV